jgi:hypothetical protein
MKLAQGAPFILSGRQSKKESCSFIDFTFGPDPPAVLCNDPVNRCQADPCTGEFFVVMQALERLEEPVCYRHVKTATVVTNKIGRAFSD